MSALLPFSPLDVPLTGVNLVEASAGTGKTWNIAALFVRLLLEAQPGEAQPASVEQILVVTYTKAATAELRARLRARLAEALAALDADEVGDAYLVELLAPYREDDELRGTARARLTAALTGFDAASIYTIHGFCQRVLTDAAFESGQPFDAELVADDEAPLLELADDFWRQRVLGDPLYARLLAAHGDTPDAWLAAVKPYLAKDYLTLVTPPPGQLAEREAVRRAAWQVLCAAPASIDAGAAAFWDGFAALKGNLYKQPTYQRLFGWLTGIALPDTAPPTLGSDTLKALGRLTQQGLADGAKKGQTPPEHPLFARIGDWLAAELAWQDAVAEEVARLKIELIRWIDTELAARRRAARQRRFDDLLTDLATGLRDPVSGPLLAEHMARSWQLALIDEFQDTDPVQYAIFRAGFIERGRPVFLVGDPKQAIYSFRGADIFAYLAARDDAGARYTLSTNHRSTDQLVAAVNALFAREQAFLLDIPYQPVASAGGRGTLTLDKDLAPLTLQWLSPEQDKPLSKDRAAKLAAASSSDAIAGLLVDAAEGGARLTRDGNNRALKGGDIAVLVSTHRQGELVRAALAERGVASVALTQESVFSSREAKELAALLRAWVDPAHEGRLRAALATELIGLTAAELVELIDDETGWETRQGAFAADHARWRDAGFMAAWRQAFVRERLAERLLPLPDGERRLTNLAQLTELIQQQSEQLAGPAPLLAWFEACVVNPPAGEEAMMRLESDAALVKIVTIHASKGLQYPLVFCPFLWDGALSRQDTAFWRYRDGGETRLVPDELAGDADHLASDSETLAEKLRLLYVALTRAEHRLVIGWTRASGMETAALSWLLHGEGTNSLEGLRELKDELSHDRLVADLHRFAGANPGAVRLQSELPTPARLAREESDAAEWHVERLERPIFTPWRVTSFTGLAQHGSRHAAEAPDHDRLVARPVESADPAEPVFDRFSFPRGARPGTCLHAIFENIDFTASPEAHAPVIAEQLARAGFGEEWHGAAADIVARTLVAPLDPGARLAEVPNRRRLVELEFLLPLQPLQAEKLSEILVDPAHGLHPACRAAAATLDFRRVEGYLKGFIDLVAEAEGKLYLVDYKSNHLGDAPDDYGTEQLAEAIAREHYYLQYLIYTVALRRYFATRGLDFGQRFGGVRYLFLRGLDETGRGVWRDMPSDGLLAALDQLFQ
ncbi:exodeoxyribonuclease V subunit beta [Neisseriaceae bacterium JH1-16]|nr:exodeoxyribonuclease V subunit beta [Neisseriaceae bacterium JH1-16]